MAYFACPKAALTGTDQATRISIAKGLVSPYFTDFSGRQVLKGVIQADAVTGRSTEYATGQSIAQRLASAGRRLTSSTGGTYVYADRNQSRGSVATKPEEQTFKASLHEGSSGTIQTTNTSAIPKNTIMIMAAIGIIGYLVLKR